MDSLSAVMASLTIAKEAASAAVGIRDHNLVAAQIAAVNDQLLKAQQGLFLYGTQMADIQNNLRETQDQLRELKRMQSERDNYALVQISEGVWVYKSKPLPEISEGNSDAVQPPHYLCQKCFDSGKKVVLQRTALYYGHALWCTACDSKLGF
ncbi:hypothetical protein LDO31_02875 [Luteimonas sp. XNQY3]|nr:hypothetical protein [Luteimonas sp. XNQY3]MCD9005190.1 hypothetical protein [Luteimonas sp. XNQY3]